MMTFEEAIQAARRMYEDSPIEDAGLALAEVMRDLTRMACDKKAHPLLRVEAMEISLLLALGPEMDTSWIPKEVRDRATQMLNEIEDKEQAECPINKQDT